MVVESLGTVCRHCNLGKAFMSADVKNGLSDNNCK